MAQTDPTSPSAWYDKIQILPKPVIYGILLVFATVPLFFADSVKLPNKPIDASIDFYAPNDEVRRTDARVIFVFRTGPIPHAARAKARWKHFSVF